MPALTPSLIVTPVGDRSSDVTWPTTDPAIVDACSRVETRSCRNHNRDRERLGAEVVIEDVDADEVEADEEDPEERDQPHQQSSHRRPPSRSRVIARCAGAGRRIAGVDVRGEVPWREYDVRDDGRLQIVTWRDLRRLGLEARDLGEHRCELLGHVVELIDHGQERSHVVYRVLATLLRYLSADRSEVRQCAEQAAKRRVLTRQDPYRRRDRREPVANCVGICSVGAVELPGQVAGRGKKVVQRRSPVCEAGDGRVHGSKE